MPRSFLVALTSLCIATSSHAATPVTIRGAGAAPCTVVLDVFRNGQNTQDRALYLQWTNGFATAVAMSNRIVDVVPVDDTMALVDMGLLTCQEPDFADARWQAAVLTSIDRLRPFWATNPARLTLTHDRSTVSLYMDAVRPLQEALRQRGFRVAVDGDYGNQTGQAVAAAHTAKNAAISTANRNFILRINQEGGARSERRV